MAASVVFVINKGTAVAAHQCIFVFEIGTTLTASSYFATLLIARSILLWAFGLLEQHIVDLSCADSLRYTNAIASLTVENRFEAYHAACLLQPDLI